MFYFINVVQGTLTPVGPTKQRPPDGGDVVVVEVDGVMTEKHRARIIAATQVQVLGAMRPPVDVDASARGHKRDFVLAAWKEYRAATKGTMVQWEGLTGVPAGVISTLVRGAIVSHDLLDAAHASLTKALEPS